MKFVVDGRDEERTKKEEEERRRRTGILRWEDIGKSV